MPYLIHVSILVGACYLLYRLLLAKEPYYQLNRWVLIGSLMASFLIPLIQIPAAWSLQTWCKQAVLPVQAVAPVHTVVPVENDEAFLLPVPDLPTRISDALPMPPKPSSSPEGSSHITPEIARSSVTWSMTQVLGIGYLIGLAFFALRWLIQLASLLRLILCHPSISSRGVRIVEVAGNIAPFSFLHWIVLNPSRYDVDTYHQILEHERVHISQGHSLDVLLAELMCVVLWFLPLAWLYRTAIKHNLEFLTDATMLQNGTPRESYQMNLLKVSAPSVSLMLVNNYNQSILKQRIAMMNASYSTRFASWKYLSILLLMLGSIISLNAVMPTSETPPTAEVATDEPPLEAVPQVLVPEAEEQATAVTEPSPEFASTVNSTSNTSQREGEWKAELKGPQLCISMSSGGFWDDWNYKSCMESWEFSNFSTNQTGRFYLKREAGEIMFEGEFDSRTGSGSFVFSPNAAYARDLDRSSNSEFSEEELFALFIHDADKEDVIFLLTNDYAAFEKEQMIQAVRHGKAEAAVNLVRAANRANYAHFDNGQLLQACMHGKAKELSNLVTSLKRANYSQFDSGQMLQACMHGKSREMIRLIDALQETDYAHFDSGQILQACMHGQAKNIADLVLDLSKTDHVHFDGGQILQACMHGQGNNLGELVSSIGAADYTRFDGGQLLQACMHSNSQEMIQMVQGLKRLNYIQFDSGQILQACMHDADERAVELVKALKAAGNRSYDSGKVLQACMHGEDERIKRELSSSGRVY